MSTTGATFTATILDSVSRSPVSGVTCDLYIFGAYVSGNTIYGTKASPLTGDTGATGITTDRNGVATFYNLAPNRYTMIVRGADIKPQVPSEYALIEIGAVIRGSPDYLQLHDATGGTWYVSATTGGTLAVSTGIA